MDCPKTVEKIVEKIAWILGELAEVLTKEEIFRIAASKSLFKDSEANREYNRISLHKS